MRPSQANHDVRRLADTSRGARIDIHHQVTCAATHKVAPPGGPRLYSTLTGGRQCVTQDRHAVESYKGSVSVTVFSELTCPSRTQPVDYGRQFSGKNAHLQVIRVHGPDMRPPDRGLLGLIWTYQSRVIAMASGQACFDYRYTKYEAPARPDGFF